MGKKELERKRAVSTQRDNNYFFSNMSEEPATEFASETGNERIEEEHRRPFLKTGQCQKGICGKEAACMSHPNNTYSCICPHDKSPPTKDWKCTRITVPPTPHPIKNIRLSAEGNSTANKNKVTENGTYIGNNNSSNFLTQSTESLANISVDNSNLYLIATVLGTVALIVVIFTFVFWKRKKNGGCLNYSKSSCTPSPSPMVLKRSLLVPERYAPNPQYSACSSATVPLLQRETLKFLNEIGEGCFGKVFKGELSTENLDEVEIVAIKVLKESATREIEEDFFREVDIMSAFRHQNILSLVGVVLRESGLSPMMVFEYMPHGDLAELLRAQKQASKSYDDNNLPQLSSRDLTLIAMQIASGMSYLASQRFVHRDLACRNCLVAAGPIVKIADFGMSRDVYTCDYYKIGGSRLLPVRWMSPESVMYGRFTLESDIWSYGIILWEIYSFGKQPYYGHSNEEVVKLILQGIMLIPPENCSPLICELMKSCWKTDPRDRIKFPEIYEKLEKVYDSFQSVDKLNLECETKSNMGTMKKLPRPPPLMTSITPRIDILDNDGYLMPKEIKEPVRYLDVQPMYE